MLRGIGKVKNSAKYRYYSINALIFIFATTIGSLLAAAGPRIFIEGVDVTTPLLAPMYYAFLEAPKGFFDVFCTRRYGYPPAEILKPE